MVEDNPDDLVFDLHAGALWPAHAYGYRILGTRETVSALGTAELLGLHGGAYHPRHMLFAAAGRVDHDAVLDLLRREGWFELEPGPAWRQVQDPGAGWRGERRVDRDSAQVHLVLGTETFRYGDTRRHALSLVTTIFGGGMSSRLFQRVREELGLAYSVHSFQSFHVTAGTQGIYLGCAPERVDEALGEIRNELALLQLTGLTAEDLAMGKQQLKGQITLSMESVGARMYRAAAVELYQEPYRPLDEVLARVDAITAGDVAAVCRDFYGVDMQTVVRLGPG